MSKPATGYSHVQFKQLLPNASQSFLEANGVACAALAQPEQGAALECALQGEKESLERIVVRFTGFRVRPLDPDGHAGSIKDLLDGLRHAHLLPDDNFWTIRLQTEQEKVATFAEERVEIEITWP